MDNLWNVISELGMELHPDRISIIAEKFEALGSINEFDELRTCLGPNIEEEIVVRFKQAWENQSHIKLKELAAALRSASATALLCEKKGSIELVWTGPTTGMVSVRHTEQVLCDVIECAKEKIFIVSFVAYKVTSIMKALNLSIDRGIEVNILLETSTKHGGRVSYDSIEMIKKTIPKINIYVWKTNDENKSETIAGAVHAKCVVADGAIALISSANLSDAAMEKNMELGVLVKQGRLPHELHQHLDALIETGKIEKI